MTYNELPEDIKILIEKEVNERFKFKMTEFLTSIKNIYPFYLNSPDPQYGITGRNLLEHYNILNERFKKEMDMSLPNDNLSLEKLKNITDSFENEFNKDYKNKLLGHIDSRIIFNLNKLCVKYIERSFFNF